jgi:hypothetical protein
VPTLSFRLLFGLLILRHDQREILWFAVTAHPTAEWMAQQVTEAIGWEKPPKYLLRDRDRVYGDAFMSRIRAMGIRDRPTAIGSGPSMPQRGGLSWLVLLFVIDLGFGHITLCVFHQFCLSRLIAEAIGFCRRLWH